MGAVRQALRFTLALVGGLALLTWARVGRRQPHHAGLVREGHAAARQTGGERGARGARVALGAGATRRSCARSCVELTHDERIMGAAACGADLVAAARTVDYPRRSRVRAFGTRRPPERRPRPRPTGRPWASVFSVPGGQVHATAVPLLEGDQGARLRRPRPRPELRRAPGGDHAAVPAARLRLPGARRVGGHRGRRAPVLAGLEQRAAPAHPRREAARPSSSRSCATSATWSSAWPRRREADGQGASGRPSGSRTPSAATSTASAS